jgi:hypothetical protein
MTLTTAAVMFAIHLGFAAVGRVDDPPVPRPDGPGDSGRAVGPSHHFS